MKLLALLFAVNASETRRAQRLVDSDAAPS
jgi:hypothetical protein